MDNMLGVIKRLEAVEKMIEQRKAEKMRAEARLEATLRELNEKFNVRTIEEAEALLAKLTEQRDAYAADIAAEVEALEKMVNENANRPA